MTADTCAAVYALIATHKRPPHPRDVYQALGLTKREYYAVLRWLEGFGFLQRGMDGLWRNATLHSFRCACGATITPSNAAFATSRGKVYRRKNCAACENAKATARKREWRVQNATYDEIQQKRVRRQQQRNASA